MDRTAARSLPRTCARVALIIVAFSLLVPAFGEAASVILEWDRNTDAFTAGYYVYYGTEPGNYTGGVDVGSSTIAVVNLNDPNATYYFAIQAYSPTGEKSLLSTELVWPQSGTPTGGTPTGGAPSGGTPIGSPSLLNPGSMSTVVGQSVNLQLTASDPTGLVLTYSASGLPPGLALGTATGFIFGIPNTPGAYNVTITVRNTNGLSESRTFTWSILNQPGTPGTIPGGGGSGTGGGGGITTGGPVAGGGGGTSGGGGSGTGGGTPIITPSIPPQDLTPPTVLVGSPSPAGGTTRTINSKIIVAGSASDNVGVVSVTWANSRGGSGAALGTSSWATGPIELQMGDNVITITAVDAAGNAKTVSVTVTRYVDLENHLN